MKGKKGVGTQRFAILHKSFQFPSDFVFTVNNVMKNGDRDSIRIIHMFSIYQDFRKYFLTWLLNHIRGSPNQMVTSDNVPY